LTAIQDLREHLLRQIANRLPAALQPAREMTRLGYLIILICNERHLDEDNSQLLRRLNEHAELILVPISHPLEHRLPALAQASYSMGERSITLDTGQKALRQQWRQQGQAQQDAWQTLAKQLGAPLLPLSTAVPLLQQLQALSIPGKASLTGTP